MKTKIYTLLIIATVFLFANKVSAQVFSEANSFNSMSSEMEIANSIPSLSNFIADISTDAVKISWVVKNEPASSKYFIEKSTDGITYVVIGSLDSKYSDSKVNQYSFVDNTPSNETVNYSVRQESIKGTLYSKLLTIEKVNTQLDVSEKK